MDLLSKLEKKGTDHTLKRCSGAHRLPSCIWCVCFPARPYRSFPDRVCVRRLCLSEGTGIQIMKQFLADSFSQDAKGGLFADRPTGGPRREPVLQKRYGPYHLFSHLAKTSGTARGLRKRGLCHQSGPSKLTMGSLSWLSSIFSGCRARGRVSWPGLAPGHGERPGSGLQGLGPCLLFRRNRR